MPFIPVPNTVAVSLGFNVSGQVGSNNIHFSKATAWTLADMGLLRTYLDTFLTGFPIGSFPTVFSWINIRITNLETASSPVIEGPVNPVVVGVDPANPLPNNCAIVVTLRTVNRGRSFRGRVYQAGLSEATSLGNTVTTTFAANVLNWWDNLINSAPPSGSYLSVVSRYSNNQPRAVGINTQVQQMTVNTQIDSQRRRMP